MEVSSITVIKTFFDDISVEELKALSRDERIALAIQAAEVMGWKVYTEADGVFFKATTTPWHSK